MRPIPFAILFLLACAPAQAQETAVRAASECDHLAASDFDPGKPATVAGRPVSAIDSRQAIRACAMASRAAPHDGRLLYQLGRALQAAKQYDKARTAYQFAVQRDHALAQLALAVDLETGRGGPSDLAEARRLYERAAASGNPLALYAFGRVNAEGIGGPRDESRGRYLDQQAVQGLQTVATAGSVEALYVLAEAHRLGRGTAQNERRARQLLEQAAGRGDPDSMTELGQLYENGQGGVRDVDMALRLYSAAARRGEEKAVANLARLGKSLPGAAMTTASTGGPPPQSVPAQSAWTQNDAQNAIVIETPHGPILIQLRSDLAPRHAERIKTLVRERYYDNVPFHRVIAGFMAQTGDGQNFNGTGGSRYPDLPAEFSNVPFTRGVVAMARNPANPNSANSQFFIMYGDAPSLNGQYTVIGTVLAGMQAVDKLKAGSAAQNGAVSEPDRMLRVHVAADVLQAMQNPPAQR